MTFRRLSFLPIAVLITPLLSAQNATSALVPKPPLLRLEVVPANTTYRVGEAVVVKYKITNLSDKTICFPRPDTKTADEVEGYIRTIATGRGGESETFIEGFYPSGIPDQQLINEANEKWIKLAPGL